MKNYYPDDYCPQREKVLDISRSVLTGGRRFARHRRNYGRYRAKVERRESRERLARAAKWMCDCGGDTESDCLRCLCDSLPTKSDINGGWGLPTQLGAESRHWGNADDVAQLFRWYRSRTAHLDHFGAEAFLRQMLLASPFGHSLKTRHAFDHLFVEVQRFRRENYSCLRCWIGCYCPRAESATDENLSDSVGTDTVAAPL